MIETGLQLDSTKEIYRVPVSRAVNVILRMIGDEDAVVEVKKAWGISGPSVSFDTPVLLDMSGGVPTELQTTETCSHLAIEVTTAGTGTADLEYNTQGEIPGMLELHQVDLSSNGLRWLRPLDASDRIVTVVVDLSKVPSPVGAKLVKMIDPASQGFDAGALATNGTPTTFTLGAVWGVGIECTTPQDDVMADVWVYLSGNVEMSGLQRS